MKKEAIQKRKRGKKRAEKPEMCKLPIQQVGNTFAYWKRHFIINFLPIYSALKAKLQQGRESSRSFVMPNPMRGNQYIDERFFLESYQSRQILDNNSNKEEMFRLHDNNNLINPTTTNHYYWWPIEAVFQAYP